LWRPGKGPIFFYTGNEGPITAFWDATGFVFDIAPQFEALIVFVEHRYYGMSLPFGNQTFKPENMGLLTVEQALADYAVFINYLKVSLNATDCPVITFGGSYGGMLSAYMRFKYPNLVTGSIAASAPIYLLTSDLDRGFFWKGVTEDFAAATPFCEGEIRKAFMTMAAMNATGMPGWNSLSKTFSLCKPLQSAADYYHLLGWIRNSLTYLAMLDYPYPATLFSPLPANPVKVACGYMDNAIDPVAGLAQAAAIFYNYSTSTDLDCFDIDTEFIDCADQTGCGLGTDSMAWDYQACTEINLVGGSNGVTDMFPIMPFTVAMRKDYCARKWNVTPRDSWGMLEFWGRDIKTASNIVFSNGDLDPWRGGGVVKAPNADIQVILIEGGAHHLDLRGQNKADPTSVLAAREVEKQAIRKWINS